MSRADAERWVIVGGGLVGLATARAVMRERPGATVTVLDKSATLAAHQSGRNSGVIHSTINYRPGSMKAALVARGRRELIEYCDAKGIDVAIRGKWVAAIDDAEAARLDELLKRGAANGETGLRIVERDELRDREPNLRSNRAMWVPSTGVVDYTRVVDALADDVVGGGGAVHLDAEVTAIRRTEREQVVTTTAGDFRSHYLIIAAGLQSDRCCRLAGLHPTARIVPFAGRYVELRARSRGILNDTVYGVPSPRLPFLGVHFTRTIDERWTVGPTALLSLRREPYTSPHRTVVRDLAGTLAYPGSWRLFRRFWRDGLREIDHQMRESVRIREIRRYLPDLGPDDFEPASTPVGVRAQAVDRAGNLVDDFRFARADGVTIVLNAPSPAATACLAIGAEIVRQTLDPSSTTP